MIIFLSRYIKKSDAKREFKTTKIALSILALLLVLQPLVFWYLIDLILIPAISDGQGPRELPFILENRLIIAVAISLIGIFFVLWFVFSQMSERKFNDRFAKYADRDDEYLIDRKSLTGWLFTVYLLPLIGLGLLGMAYLYLCFSSIADAGQPL